MEMTNCESSSLVAFGYDEDESKLRVQFNNGRVAVYSDVPAEIHAALMSAHEGGESVGRAFGSLVRNGGFAFEYEA